MMRCDVLNAIWYQMLQHDAMRFDAKSLCCGVM